MKTCGYFSWAQFSCQLNINLDWKYAYLKATRSFQNSHFFPNERTTLHVWLQLPKIWHTLLKIHEPKTYPSLFRMILSNKFSIGLVSYDSIYRVKKTVRAAVKSSILQLQQKQIMWKAHSQIITFGLNRVLRWPIKEKKIQLPLLQQLNNELLVGCK